MAKTVGIVNGRGGRRPGTLDTATNDLDPISRIHAMPAEVGVLLIVSGIGGSCSQVRWARRFCLGCLMLWPKAFHQTGKCFETRFPKMHYHGVKQINRFLVDLEKRYPPAR